MLNSPSFTKYYELSYLSVETAVLTTVEQALHAVALCSICHMRMLAILTTHPVMMDSVY